MYFVSIAPRGDKRSFGGLFSPSLLSAILYQTYRHDVNQYAMEDALSFADGVGGGSTAGDGQFVCFAYAHKWRLRRGVADLLTIASRSPLFLLCGPIR